MFKRIDHIVLLVRNVQEAATLYKEKFNCTVSPIEEDTANAVRQATFDSGNVRVVIMEPTDPQGDVARFLQRRGEGIYLVALEVDSIDREVARLKGQGRRIVDSGGSGGQRRLVFIHPRDSKGVLLQLVERG